MRGFSLVELLVTITLLAIVTSLAAPSFKRTIQSGRISSGVNTFLADMRFARSEAIKRGGNVVMCRSDAPEAANPVCGAGNGPGDAGWASGWFIFHDLDGDGIRDVGGTPEESVLRVQQANSALGAIVDSGASTTFRFTATGRLYSLGAVTSLQFGSDAAFSEDLRRIVCINISGRARVAGDGAASCGADT
jgi:type IV fimbrial biogenesis protein FimT